MSGGERQWSLEAEDGTTCYTSAEVAGAVASGEHGYTLGIDRSPIVAAFTRRGPDFEWVRLVAATPETSEADPGTGEDHWTCGGCGYEGNGPDNFEWTEHTKVCPDLHPATPDAGDVEALTDDLFRWNTPTDPYFIITGRRTLDREGEDAYAPIARAVLASDWLASHDAATADRVRREVAEAIVAAIEADANSHTTGWTSTNHRAYAGHFARIAREAETRDRRLLGGGS